MHLVQQNTLRMYFFHKFLSQFLGFNGFFRAFREIFPSKMPHCTYFICPIYKIRIGVSSGITPAPIHIYYNCISKICQSACFAPRRNTSRKMARASGPQYSICQHRAMGMLQPQVCTQVPKLGSLNSSVATRLITGHIMQTIISMRSARPPAAAAEVFHKRGPRLGRARRSAGLRTVFVVFCRLFSRFQQKFVYFFV